MQSIFNKKIMKKTILIFALLFGFFAIGQGTAPLVDQVRFKVKTTAEMNALPRVQEGSVCYNQTDKSLFVYNGTFWVGVGGVSVTDQAKLNNLTISQPVDLDDIESKANSALQSYTETDPTVNKAKIDALGVDYESLSNKPSQSVVSQGGRIILLRTGGTQAQYDIMTVPAGIDDILEFPTDAGSGEIPTDAYVTGGNLSGSNLILQQNGISNVSISLAGLGSSADGSETKVEAGANTTVTGLGTVASPYIVSSTGTSGGTTTYSAGTGLTQNGTVFSLATSVENRIAANDVKVGITSGQASAITANSAKVGITTAQSNAIVTNTAKPTQAFNDGRYLNISGVAANSNLLNGIQLSQIVNPQLNYLVYDTRLVDTPTDLGERGVKFEFKTNGTGGLSDGSSGFYGVQTFQQWDVPAGGETHQLAFTGNKNLWLRNASIDGTWNSWAKIWHSENDGINSGLDADLVRGQVPLFSIPDNSVTNAKLADASISNSKIIDSQINVSKLSATGTRNSSTVLHGDNTWKPIVSGGTGDISGTGVNNELAVFTGNKTIANSGITVSAGGNDLFVPNTVVANGEVLVSQISGNIVSGNLTYSGSGWSTTQTAPIQINYSKVGKQVFIRGSLASPVSRTLNDTQGTGGIINIPGLPFAGNGETTILVGADNTGSTYNSTPIINGKVSGTTISIELYFSPPYSSGTISNPYILSFSGTYITN